MLLWNQAIMYLCVCHHASHIFEFLGEGLFIQENPGVIVLVVESVFQVAHGGTESIQFAVSDQYHIGSVNTR